MRVLMAGPALDHASGGIPAVAEGLMGGLSEMEQTTVEYFPYCSSQADVSLPMRAAVAILNLLKFPFILKRFSPSLTHFHTSIRQRSILRDIGFVLIARVLRVPVILELHGGRIGLLGGPYRTVFSGLLRLANCIVLTSKEQEAELLSLYPGVTKRVQMIPNPIVLPKPIIVKKEKNEEFEAGNGLVRIVFASRLVKEKGAAELIAALDGITHRSGWIAEIYGDGPEKQNIDGQIAELSLHGQVLSKGNVPLPDLLRVFLDSDIFVFPSLHAEGFPMAFFFAVASGMAIVTSKISPIHEYLDEPGNCIYVDPQSTVEIQEALSHLIEDKKLRREMGQRNSMLAEQFRPENVVPVFSRLYAEVVNAQ